jgi:urease accessory protein
MSALIERSISQKPLYQRANGCLDIALEERRGQASVIRLYQEGCLKARYLRAQAIPEIVSINISGGIVGGDVLASRVVLGAGAKAVFTSQAAERVYKALEEPSCVSTKLSLGPQSILKYIPQETILFDGFNLNRSLDVDLMEGAKCIGVESIVFGRAAMGETVRNGIIRDRITLTRNGKMIWRDMLTRNGDIAASLAIPGIGKQTRAIANLFAAGINVNNAVSTLKEKLECNLAGISICEDVIFLRIISDEARTLRRAVIRVLGYLDNGTLPRVWQI